MKIEETIKATEDKLLEIRAAKKELEQERALKEAPVVENRNAEKTKLYADLQKEMKEKRAVTVSGTGTVSVIADMVYALEAKKNLLSEFSIFTGASSSTIIPVWNNAEGEFAPVAEDGTFSAGSETMATTTVQPFAFGKQIKVNDQVLKLSGVDFENQINKIITNASNRTILKQIFNGTGASGQFTAITSGATASTKTAFNMAGLQDFALTLMDKTDSGKILMNPTVYETLVDCSTKKDEILMKKLLEEKTIEGVPVLLSSYVPSTVYAIGCDPKNYALGVADELQIVPKTTAGSLVHTYDASIYMNGKPIVPTDVYVYNVQP